MKKTFLVAACIVSLTIAFTACKNNDTKTSTEMETKAGPDQLAKNEMYTCTMHNEVMSDHSGKCPKCGMKLVKQKMTAEQEKMMQEGTYMKPAE